jgi:hypothetical protein
LDEVVAVHRDRMSMVRAIVDGLTDAELKRICDQNSEEGHPEKTTYPVWVPLMSAINEGWEHHRYACRDLEVLT